MTFRRLLILAGILVLAHAAWNWSQAAEEDHGHGRLGIDAAGAVEQLGAAPGTRGYRLTWSQAAAACRVWQYATRSRRCSPRNDGAGGLVLVAVAAPDRTHRPT